MINCYSSGSIFGNEDVGGLAGFGTGLIVTSYSSAFVSGDGEYVGGLTGYGGPAVNSFWDIQASGQTVTAGGRGRTTQQMMQAKTYVGWNGDGQVDWIIDEDKDYPRLAWEGKPGQPIPVYSLSDFLPGSGTEDDPYLIATVEQFNSIGCFPSQWDKYYRLVADVNLVGIEYTTIGVGGKAFSGVLDGNGHTISNFTYQSNNSGVLGLVGVLDKNGVIKNIGLVDVLLRGYVDIGGLVGINDGKVSNCYASGTVSGDQYVGGLVGYNFGTVNNCHSSISVSEGWYVGGLVGFNTNIVTNCYSSGSVSGFSYVGGLVGSGYSRISVVQDSFWDIETSRQSWSAGGKGMTTAQMQDINTYLTAGWDFIGETANGVEDIWFMPASDYPMLVWEKDNP